MLMSRSTLTKVLRKNTFQIVRIGFLLDVLWNE